MVHDGSMQAMHWPERYTCLGRWHFMAVQSLERSLPPPEMGIRDRPLRDCLGSPI